jgi:hypothetical protein
MRGVGSEGRLDEGVEVDGLSSWVVQEVPETDVRCRFDGEPWCSSTKTVDPGLFDMIDPPSTILATPAAIVLYRKPHASSIRLQGRMLLLLMIDKTT